MWKVSNKVMVNYDSVDFRLVIGMKKLEIVMYKGIYCVGIYSEISEKTFLEKERYYSFHECFEDFKQKVFAYYPEEKDRWDSYEDQLKFKAEDRLVREC